MNTAQLCATNRIALNATFAILDSAALLYTYISRFFVNPHYHQREKIRQRCYRNSVPNRFSSRFSTSLTNGLRLFTFPKAGTHSAFGEGSHTTAHTPKHGPFQMGVVSLPSERSARSRTSPDRVSERHNFAAFGSWPDVLPKNAESLRDSDALMRVAVPRRRGPAGLRDLFSFLSKLWLVYPALRAFCVCEVVVVSLPSACFTCC